MNAADETHAVCTKLFALYHWLGSKAYKNLNYICPSTFTLRREKMYWKKKLRQIQLLLIHLFLCILIFADSGKHSCLWIFNIIVLPKSAYKPVENLFFVEHLILWVTCTQESNENWYPTNTNESTVCHKIVS